jgi:hypothetical protein
MKGTTMIDHSDARTQALVIKHANLLVEIACASHQTFKETGQAVRKVWCPKHQNVHFVYKNQYASVWDSLKSFLDIETPLTLDQEKELSAVSRQLVNILDGPMVKRTAKKPAVQQKTVAKVKKQVISGPSPLSAAKSNKNILSYKNNISLTEAEAEEFSSCIRKRMFINAAAAETFRDRAADSTDFHVYSCNHCEWWHIGHIVNENAARPEGYYRMKLLRLSPQDKNLLIEFKRKVQVRREYLTQTA